MRVLIASQATASDPRLRQISRLYGTLGLVVDHVTLADPAGTGPVPTTGGRLAVLPQPGTLGQMVDALHRELPITILHADRWAAAASLHDCSGSYAKVFDATMAADGALAGQLDVVLTGSETLRRARAANGTPALRLPTPLPPFARLTTKPTGLIGWWGVWDDGLANGWCELLEALTATATLPPCRLLIAGPGADRVRLPGSLLAPIRRPGLGPSCLRALDLALLPTVQTADRADEIHQALCCHIPVLGLADGMAGYEDRWHLPVAEDAAGLADLLGHVFPPWQAETKVGELSTGLALTQEALRRDQETMERYVSEQLGALLPEPVPV